MTAWRRHCSVDFLNTKEEKMNKKTASTLWIMLNSLLAEMEAQMNEVYCSKCKWAPRILPWTKYCRFIVDKDWGYTGMQLTHSTMDYLNGKNDCPYYEHKWWMFWA